MPAFAGAGAVLTGARLGQTATRVDAARFMSSKCPAGLVSRQARPDRYYGV